ncbi:MAG: polymerase subunit alpha [Thermosediminibacterales bacterium]|nr:polymerase subunit alpha [Thermosediminibacterales bacterium]MDK2835689.1 polymerase subunit alpha [Thermosediminibacterales bacterium]
MRIEMIKGVILMFVPLHVHTCYSLLDGSIRISDLLDRAVEFGMPAVAITDHGALYGAVEFYQAAKARNIKPIIGCEVYVAPRKRNQKEPGKDDFQYHLVLLAKNKQGYKNLSKLVTAGFLEGFYYKPRIDKELLESYSEGLIALSGCLAGEIPSLILKGEKEKALETAKWYRDLFGKNGFFLELQDHGIKDQKMVNRELIRMSKELDIPLVATNDTHYLEKKDAKIHEILLCIQTQKTIDDPDRLKFEGKEFYLKNEEQMRELFRDCPEAVDNTYRIAKMINLEFDFNRVLIPSYMAPPEFDSAMDYLRYLCYEGLRKRYKKITTEIRERLEHELNIIHKMGYEDYFLIVWDFVNFAKRNNIPVGPGRGSAAGSIVSYVLFITDLDPLPYGLLFERFLNPERVTMPDIDIDFCKEKRDLVIDYVAKKYGRNKVSQIITFGRMAARMAVRDAGRVMGFSPKEIDRIAKKIPQGMDIKTAVQTDPDLKTIYNGQEEYRNLLDTAMAIEGLPRHTSTHAAGVVISTDELTNYAPLQKTEGVLTTQYDMESLEKLGLLKMDFLGLKTLMIMHETIRRAGTNINLNNIPLDDSKTYELLSHGDTSGVFQLESSGMRSILRKLKPTCLEDIIAVVALYRPGPIEQIPVFIANKHSSKIEYLHPDLASILKPTYGVIVYQEQIMQIASKMAGFSLGQADILRRAIGKKKKDVLEKQKTAFIQGVTERYNRKLGEKLYDLIEKFALASLLSGAKDDSDKVAVYVAECREKGIKVLPPDVNESDVDFTVTGKNCIRFGLAAVKNTGKGAIESIIETRTQSGRFSSLYDFCRRVDLSKCNRRVIESLIKSGAFDSLGRSRAELLNTADKAYIYGQQGRKTDNQLSLFSQIPELTQEYGDNDISIPEFPYKLKLLLEKEMLGLYVSGHPLDEYRENLKNFKGIVNIKGVKEDKPEKALIAGIISSVRRIITQKGQPMCFLRVEDFTGSIDVVVFQKNMMYIKKSSEKIL